LNKYPDSIDKAAMFLKALPKRMGTVAAIGYPAEIERAAKLLTPELNLSMRAAGLMLITEFGKITPSS
jgi:hypothetical protein